MAYPPTPSLLLSAVPGVQSWTGFVDPANGPLTTTALSQGDTISADTMNERAGRLDLTGRYGGGVWGVIPGDTGFGVGLTAGAGLTLNIDAGHAMFDGIRVVDPSSITLTNNISRVFIWLSQSGAFVQVNASTTPPAGPHLFLGSCVTNSPAGSISGIDFTGVVYLDSFLPQRFSNDSGMPADTPPANVAFLHYCEGDGSRWLWTGSEYLVFGGLAGTLPIADGGTGATTAPAARVNLSVPQLGVYTLNPANGTNVLDATQSNNSVIIITGGTASSQFAVEFTVAGSPAVRAGHTWEVVNRTSYGVLIRRSGSGLANVFLGQGSANDQRGRYLWDGSEIRRVAKDQPTYSSQVITADQTATRGQVEVGFLVTGSQSGNWAVNLPNTGGFEGQVTAHQADAGNYALTVKTSGETEPDATTMLLPGEVQQVVQDAAGRHWRVGRPYTRRAVVNMPSNADYTLTPSEARAFILEITDTTPFLTADRDIIWAVSQVADHKLYLCRNRTARTLRFKTTGGGGVYLAPGKAGLVFNNGTDLVGGSGQADTTTSLLSAGLLFASTATATVANTGTESTLIGSGVGSLTLPANSLTPGRSVRLTARGLLSSAAVPGTLTIALKLGSTGIVTTGAQTPTALLTDLFWECEVLLTCRTTGATGTVIAQGSFRYFAAAVGAITGWEMIDTSTVTVDTTASKSIDLTADWLTADASNSIRGTNCVAELIG